MTPNTLHFTLGGKAASADSLSGFYAQLMQSAEFRSGDCAVTVSGDSQEAGSCRDLLAFLQAYLTAKRRLSAKMEQINSTAPDDAESPDVCHLLGEFSRMNRGGKFIRGALVTMGYALFAGQPADYSDDLALAFELFQTAILIHDDIIDHAKLRRSHVTIHENYLAQWEQAGIARCPETADTANSLALLAGDAGMYLANLRICTAYADDPALGRISAYFYRTALKTMYGETVDVALPFRGLHGIGGEEDITGDVLQICRLKTAWYTLIGPLCLGALLAGCGETQLHRLEAFAEALGIAFQIKDDILGVYGSTETGKDIGSDISEFKQTLLYAYVRKTGRQYDELMRYYGKKTLSQSELAAVQEIFRQSGALGYAEQTMNRYFDSARSLLAAMPDLPEERRAELRGLVLFMDLRTK